MVGCSPASLGLEDIQKMVSVSFSLTGPKSSLLVHYTEFGEVTSERFSTQPAGQDVRCQSSVVTFPMQLQFLSASPGARPGHIWREDGDMHPSSEICATTTKSCPLFHLNSLVPLAVQSYVISGEKSAFFFTLLFIV